jgi:hypothetical protein
MIANNELERMCTEGVAAQFKVLSQHFPGVFDENNENPKPG